MEFTSCNKRRSIRLSHFDYSQAGAYFITLCAHERQCLFGNIVNHQVKLNHLGKIIADEWEKTGLIRKQVELDSWVIMPNHFHAILFINWNDQVNQGFNNNQIPAIGPKTKSLGAIVGGFKAAVTRRNNLRLSDNNQKVWQRNYWDRVIRNEEELSQIREYIQNNPLKWELDKLYVK